MSFPGFYKFSDDILHYAATSIHAPDFVLLAANHADYTYPTGGWYWFDSRQQAEAFWGINGQSNARWLEFGAALAADALINQFFGGLLSTAPVLHSMLGVGLGQAAQGDSRTFVTAWSAARSQGLITDLLVQHLATLARAHDLPTSFINALLVTPRPENPERFTEWTEPDGSQWIFDQPRDPSTGRYLPDDPTTEQVESQLTWVRKAT